MIVLVRRERRSHSRHKQIVEFGALNEFDHDLVYLPKVLVAELEVCIRLKILVLQAVVLTKLVLVAEIVTVPDHEILLCVLIDLHPSPRRGAKDRPLREGLYRPWKVIVEADQGRVGTGVGIVDREYVA